jgi:hypothetical protein
VASRANRKIVAAKCAFAVVTGRATRGAGTGAMIQRHGRRHLPALRETWPDFVTLDARESLRCIVLRMTEPDAIRRSLFRSADEAAELMTRAARRDVAPARRFGAGRVTTKTDRVCVQPRRDRQRHTAAAASMALRTISAGSGVLRVIEPHVEASQRWKWFHLSTLRIGVTDRTDLAGVICKLLLMTARTRRVLIFARQRWLRVVVRAAMTEQTRQPRVIRIVVFELRIARLRINPRFANTGYKNHECNE